ncbi:hypothetical protein EB118_03845 [bacterium]|nr:hypothetical protein [bacterium]NBX97351.1 hypothetical protein [bacterium]NDC94783.1 hypothetical protein [bacterium]NDD84524.1 hypothetical protein [bacterium]NDG29218.1 hypothetical protein [bacterium]
MGDNTALEKLFDPKELDEVNRLAMQDNPDLAPLAYERLSEISNIYGRQEEGNRSYVEDSGAKLKKTAYISMSAGAIGLAGMMSGNRLIALAGLSAAGFNVLRNFRLVVAHTIGYPGPFPDATKKKSYITNVMQAHPGKTQEV